MKEKTVDLEGFHGTIVGEAEGTKINFPGILFRDTDRDINDEPFRLLNPHTNTDIDAIKSPDFIIDPTGQVSLKHGDYIKSNKVLAFVRAFLVKERMITSMSNQISPNQISVCAKANTKKGNKYRKISLAFTISDFFKNNTKTLEEINEEIQNVKDAIAFYNKVGYPKDNQSDKIRTYDKCPCYETK